MVVLCHGRANAAQPRFIAGRAFLARDGKEMVLVADPSHALYISGETVPIASFQWDHALVIKWQPLHKILSMLSRKLAGKRLKAFYSSRGIGSEPSN